MSEFEDKLNKILSSPEDMEKIMGMARSLTGNAEPTAEAEAASAPSGSMPDISSILGKVDPKVFNLMGRAMAEYTTGPNDKSVLLSAMKPYVREARREKLDQAADIAKLARIAKLVFSELPGGGE